MPAGIPSENLQSLYEDYYEALHAAYRAMRKTFKRRARDGLTQEEIARFIGRDEGLVSRRLNGEENLTLKSLSFMATAMKCRLVTSFVPYEHVGFGDNYFISDDDTPQQQKAAVKIPDDSPQTTSNAKVTLTESVNA
jgi:transcriptional regulator with XRE-family HTH domain